MLSLAKTTLKLKIDQSNKNFTILISEYRNFIPLKKFIDSSYFENTKYIDLFLEHLEYNLKIMNRLGFIWSDPGLHNMMTVQNKNEIILIPIDFLSDDQDLLSKELTQKEIFRRNNNTKKHIITYINSHL